MLVPALILGPIAAGAGLLWLKSDPFRKILVSAVTLLICAGVLALAVLPAPDLLPLDYHWLNAALMAIEGAMGLYVIYVGLRARRPWIVGLMLAQAGLMAWLEWAHGAELKAAHNLLADKLSITMALINGLVGGGICLYALGYMREYHRAAHPEVPDRRPLFFGLLFIFTGAMFGLIFSNNLLWLFLFWEITTLCSFLLIGYTGTQEARANALRALVMNLAGGLGFALAIAWFARQSGSIELRTLAGSQHSLALLPAALLCFAGITKSAQLPFSSWLLGAMVAPTPISALLHSSTMVKAGVYLVLRMAPVVTGTAVGYLVALVGAVTFLAGSLAAITTSDAKKVLAWSTIANLGLIVLCGGIGTHEAVWAGILLIIFHAAAKCLLFLCVGVVEHRLHSRDIEAMSGLVLNMPRVAVMMQLGMAGMFLAPFGMLISKWAVLKAVVDAAPSLSIFLVFGSAATLFFWVKWIGKLLEVQRPRQAVAQTLALGQNIALSGLSVVTALACLLFPLISAWLIQPYVVSVYGQCGVLTHGNVVIMTIMMVMILLFPLSFINYGRGVRVTDAYLGGANLHSSTRFLGAGNTEHDVATNNYHLHGLLSEAWLARGGVICAAALLVLLAAAAVWPML
ncbi:MAG TPA: proton-conducting transporter membrane subunit [Candidatus Paceibacterota bacterium]|nr:proton-conducting transporter membrane subunit [Verrucomicrobiota bacterium]HSA10327.1 proton-conducting transporter membrane subunit [Candidatus Paceibacterota bacterium]